MADLRAELEQLLDEWNHHSAKLAELWPQIRAVLDEAAGRAPSRALEPLVTIRELAERIQMDVSACRKYVLGLGYRPMKRRTVSSSYQMALTVTEAQAREIQARRAADGYCQPPGV